MRRLEDMCYSEKHDVYYYVQRSENKKTVLHVEIYDPRTQVYYLCRQDGPKHFSDSRSSFSVKWYNIRLKQFNMSQHALAVTKAILFPEERAKEKAAEQQLTFKF